MIVREIIDKIKREQGLTTLDIALKTGCREQTVYNWMKNDRLPKTVCKLWHEWGWIENENKPQ